MSAEVAWFTTHEYDGRVLRTVDGGETFDDVAPPDAVAEDVSFTDVEASSAAEALVFGLSRDDDTWRIYRTADGGASWRQTFRSDAPGDDFLAYWFECLTMFDRRRGFLIGPVVHGRFQVYVTGDRGQSWVLAPAEGMPRALPLEGPAPWIGSSCASATGRKGFFGTTRMARPAPSQAASTGSARPPTLSAGHTRVFRTTDFGLTWEASPTPIRDTIIALDFRTNRLGLAIGDGELARTTDGGVTWQSVDKDLAPRSVVHDLAWWSDRRGDARSSIAEPQRTVFAVGQRGSDFSADRGKSWEHLDDTDFYSVDCAARSSFCWAGGPGERIAQLVQG